MAPLTPQHPSEVMVIRQLNSAITTLSVPFWRFGRIKIGGRGTLVKLQSGGVAVFSPVALTPEVKETVSRLGELKYIAALDIEHHIFLGPWHEAYPSAKVLGPHGLEEKRKKQNNEPVPFAVTFSPDSHTTVKVDPEFDAEFDYAYVPEHTNRELVFLHKPTRSLITADLLFNLPATEQFSRTNDKQIGGLATKIFSSFQNTQGDALGQKRFLWYAASKDNRPGFNKNVATIASWDFDTIIPCHGDVIESGGKAVFQKVFAWHLAGLNAKAKDTAAS